MPIFDQGYRHWTGHLSGHAWRWFAITRQGVRNGMKGRVLRICLIVSWLPAIGLAFVMCIWGMIERKSELVEPIAQFLSSTGLISPQIVTDPRHYRLEIWTLCYSYFLALELRLSMILILLVGPNLISQDLRFNALPLYLSRPLRRIDYVFGKLGIIAAFLGMVIVVPCLLAYGLGLLFSLDFSIVKATYSVVLASLAYALVIIVSAGMLILALSSLSRNSRYVALFWLGIWIVSGIASTVLDTMDRAQRWQAGRGQMVEAEMEASKGNWRPMVSYTANLSRVGRHLLGTDDCLKTLSQFQRGREREMFLLQFSGPQYPWYWSAGVLAVLFGISAWILSFPLRSLDRQR